MEPKEHEEDIEICQDDGKFEETVVYDFSSGDSCGFMPSPPAAIQLEIEESYAKSVDDFRYSFTSCGFSPSPPTPVELEFEESDSKKVDDFRPKSTSSPIIKSSPVLVISSGSSESDDEQKSYVEQLPVKKPIVLSSASSEDDPIEQLSSHNIEMHSGKIPIYSKASKSLTSKEILQLCFGEVKDEYICKQKPISVRYNAVFVVDLHSVDLRSLYADDNGVWQTSSQTTYLRVFLQNGKVDNVEMGNPIDYTHRLKRQYGKHQATYIEKHVTFQRIISTVYSKTHQCRYGVVQYIHRDSIEEDIVMNPHRNAKKLKRAYYKTDPAVLDDIKQEAQHTKPKRLFKALMDKAGGPLMATSAASEPRNVKQIYNIRSSQKPQPDEFTHLVSQIKEDSFVRELTIDSGFIQYILTTDKQLIDLRAFCTNPVKFSVFLFWSIVFGF